MKMTMKPHDCTDLLLHWRDLIREAESSGRTRVAWMKEHAIKESTYYYWHRKLSAKGMFGSGSVISNRETGSGNQEPGYFESGAAFVEYPFNLPDP